MYIRDWSLAPVSQYQKHFGENVILQPLSHLSTHIMEGKLQMFETNHKSKEIANVYPIFLHFYCDSLRWNFHVFISQVSLRDSGLFD